MGKIYKIQTYPFTDQLTADGHQLSKLPYPFFVDEKGLVGKQDLWNGDPFRVIGFQKDLAIQEVNLWWNDAMKDPSQAVDMYLVTSSLSGNFGTHTTAVSSLVAVSEEPPDWEERNLW